MSICQWSGRVSLHSTTMAHLPPPARWAFPCPEEGKTTNSSRRLTDAQIAWAAGLFEGEGSVSVAWVKGRAYASMSMMLTDDDVLYRFRDLIGGRVSTSSHRGGNTKPIWSWRLYGRDKIEPILKMFWPWLGDRRKEQAANTLALSGYVDRVPKTHCPAGHPLDETNTYIQPKNGGRQCRICKAESSRRRYAGVTGVGGC